MKVIRSTFPAFLLLIVFTFHSFAFGVEKLPKPFRIIPQPKQVELIGGSGLKYGDLKAVRITGDLSRPVMGPILSRLPQTEKGSKGLLTLRLDENLSTPESAEGYVLKITNGNVEIVSRGKAGLFYGCQTLEQLLQDAGDTGTSIPACRIIDYPALSYRAVHFDVKHHLDHMNYYYDSIDRLARYKINAVIFEFEDKLRYRRQPLVGAPQAISIDEMAALTDYARKRHIEISPLVQGLGHATFILKHRQYAYLREQENNRWAFCPLHEGTYQVLFDLYRDAIEATPGSRYLHVGGDEVGNIGICPRCKPTADKKGMLYLNLYWLNRVCDFAAEHGRIPIFWDDMPFKYAGLWNSVQKDVTAGKSETDRLWSKNQSILDSMIESFPKNAVYMRWLYNMARNPGNIRALEWYRDSGLKSMIATGIQSGPAALFPPDDRGDALTDRGVVAIKSFIQLAAEKNIDGMLCTAWDDRSPHMETYWRGFIAAAEYSWSPQGRTLGEYDRAYFQREYGPGTAKYPDLYHQLRQAASFWEMAFSPKGTRMDIPNALLILPGIAHWMPPQTKEQKRIDFEKRLIGLPDISHPGAWSQKYAKRLDRAKREAEKYKTTSRQLDELERGSLRNRYHWRLFSAVNDFQITAAHLLLALQKCDTADKDRQKEGAKAVQAALSEFDAAWDNLKNVYSETRFIAYPANYVPDRYFHFASQREDLTWMIQAEELYHKMIREWMKGTIQ